MDEEHVVLSSRESIDYIVDGITEAMREGRVSEELAIGVTLLGEMAKKRWDDEHGTR